MTPKPPITRLLITPGEPAGIGPDIVLQLVSKGIDTGRGADQFQLCAIADPQMLAQRAQLLGLDIRIKVIDLADEAVQSVAGELCVYPVTMSESVEVGKADPKNANYVVSSLDVAIQACLKGMAQGMVTGPINKASIIDAGFDFVGHTEYLAQRTSTQQVVMMLASDAMRVALATTHLPLADVSGALTADSLEQTIRILCKDLQTRFHLPEPSIVVCGLNPHAGENGHMGSEEISCITPVCDKLRAEGFDLLGPLPADTAFTQKYVQNADAVLAMFHDQGLPVIKYASFGDTVNITLGLPIIRTSVDHGTALDIAGTGQADCGSLEAAIQSALTMVTPRLVPQAADTGAWCINPNLKRSGQ